MGPATARAFADAGAAVPLADIGVDALPKVAEEIKAMHSDRDGREARKGQCITPDELRRGSFMTQHDKSYR
jgi:hypothetical protein